MSKCSKFKLLFSLMSSILVISCTTYTDYIGKHPTTEQLSKIKIGVATKQEVFKHMGSPSSVIAFDPNTWIYDYRIQTRESFFTPVEVEHCLYTITFNSQNVVQDIKKSTQLSQKITPCDSVTETPQDEKSFFRSIFGGFGKRAKKALEDEEKDQ